MKFLAPVIVFLLSMAVMFSAGLRGDELSARSVLSAPGGHYSPDKTVIRGSGGGVSGEIKVEPNGDAGVAVEKRTTDGAVWGGVGTDGIRVGGSAGGSAGVDLRIPFPGRKS